MQILDAEPRSRRSLRSGRYSRLLLSPFRKSVLLARVRSYPQLGPPRPNIVEEDFPCPCVHPLPTIHHEPTRVRGGAAWNRKWSSWENASVISSPNSSKASPNPPPPEIAAWARKARAVQGSPGQTAPELSSSSIGRHRARPGEELGVGLAIAPEVEYPLARKCHQVPGATGTGDLFPES